MQTTEILRRGTRRLPSLALSAQRCAALLALAFTACVPRAARGPAASRIAPSRIVAGDFVQVRHASDPAWITSGQIESGAGRSLTVRVARPEPRDTAGSVTRVLSSRQVVVELPWQEVKQLLLPIYVARERGIPYEGGPPPRYQCGLGVCPSNLIVGAGCAAALIAWAASKHDASIFGAVFIQSPGRRGLHADFPRAAAKVVGRAAVLLVGGRRELGRGARRARNALSRARRSVSRSRFTRGRPPPRRCAHRCAKRFGAARGAHGSRVHQAPGERDGSDTRLSGSADPGAFARAGGSRRQRSSRRIGHHQLSTSRELGVPWTFIADASEPLLLDR